MEKVAFMSSDAAYKFYGGKGIPCNLKPIKLQVVIEACIVLAKNNEYLKAFKYK